MKNNIIIWLLVSFFATLPSFAQDVKVDKTAADIRKEIEEKKDSLAKTTDIETTNRLSSDINSLSKALAKQEKKEQKAAEKLIKDQQKAAEKLKKDQQKAAKKNGQGLDNQNNNGTTSQGQAQTGNNEEPGYHFETPSNNKVSNETGHNDVCKKQDDCAELRTQYDDLVIKYQALVNENQNLKEEINKNIDIKNEFNKLLTDNFIQKWGEKPFSQFDEKLFQKEIQKISEKFSETPQTIQKLVDDYSTYKEGEECINSKYDEQAIKSVIGKIKTLRDNTKNPDKKKELADLHTKLFDYEGSVERFQNVIKNVTDALKVLGKTKTEQVFADPDIVKEIDLKIINAIPWLKRRLVDLKKELSIGKTTVVQNEILHLLE